MGEAERKGRDHYRGKARVGRRVEVTFAPADAADETTTATAGSKLFTKNIGVGGAFLLTTEPLPAGTKLTVTLALPNRATPLPIAAEVRWIIDGKDDEPEAEHGMGVRFAGITGDDLLLLNEYFASIPDSIDSIDID